jgi:hypothetical protein
MISKLRIPPRLGRAFVYSNLTAILALGTLVPGCGKDDSVSSYSAPKTQQSAPQADQPTGMGQMPTAAPAVAGTSDAPIAWTLPANWKQLPGDGKLRFATIQTDGNPPLSVSVVRLNGPGGKSMIMNVNRWEGQLKLPVSSDADLGKLVQTSMSAAGPVHTVDLLGPAGDGQERILGALYFAGDESWSFYIRGPVAQVASAQAGFNALVASLRPNAASPTATSPMMTAPAATADQAGAPSALDQAHGSGLADWTLPAGWENEPPTSAMRVLSIKAGSSELIISRFGKEAMSDKLMNINRWRGMVQLAQADSPDANPPAKITVAGIDSELYDFPGSANRLLVAVVPQGQTLWFFKFMGPVNDIATQKPAFEAFLKSVKLSADQ